jgi:hypothetical protein
MDIEQLKPGQRVRVVQTIDRREGDWQQAVEGVIDAVDVEATGSWYAHAKDDKFWLRRVRLTKADGERTTLVVDQYTRIEVLGGA